MENSTLDRRVEMIKKARELSSHNKETINGVQSLFNESKSEQKKSHSGYFMAKLLLAIIIFIGYVILDQSKAENLFVTSDKITKAIAYNSNIEKYVEAVFNQIKQ